MSGSEKHKYNKKTKTGNIRRNVFIISIAMLPILIVLLIIITSDFKPNEQGLAFAIGFVVTILWWVLLLKIL